MPLDAALQSYGVGLVLSGARIAPVCLLIAFHTRGIVPQPVALSLTLSLALAFAAPVSGLALPSLTLLGACARELALGLTFALAVLLPLSALGWAARLAEHAVPALAQKRSPLALLYAWLAGFSFFALSGHRALVMGLSASLGDVPLGGLSFARSTWLFGCVGFVADALAFAFALALPLLLSLWIAGALVALIARVFGAGTSLDGGLRAPLYALLLALLAAPLVARVPEATRAGLAAGHALLKSTTRGP